MTSVSQKHKMWQKPWGYSESVAVVVGVVTIGLILQLAVGSFDFYLLATPVNLYAGATILGLCLVMGILGKNSQLIKWFTSIQMTVSLIIAFLVMTIIMGITMQVNHSQTFLGFDAMTSNWAFVLIYMFTLISLGTLIVRRFTWFSWRDCAFHLNHIGLWLLLTASGLGYADIERYIMHVQEGQTEWRVYGEDKKIKELPIAIQLNDFDMDVYPPKLAMIDRNTGEVLPLGKPQYLQIEQDVTQGKLNGWEIHLSEYIHQAVRNSDSTYREVPMPGATPAIKVIATKEGQTVTGWICAGNTAQIYMTLPLNTQNSMVMTAAEPRSFSSDIEVYTENGERYKASLEVNKPLRVGLWTIYQYGYDNNAGKLSSYSSFELVYDPWVIPVYVGILMMMCGMGVMIWKGRIKKEVVNDME